MTVSIDLSPEQLASIAAQTVVTPPPVVDPPPVVPPPVVEATIITRTTPRPYALNMAAKVLDVEGHTLWPGFSDGNRYLREQQAIELKGPSIIRGFTENVVLTPATATTPAKIGPLPFGFGGILTGVLIGSSETETVIGTALVAATDSNVYFAFNADTIPPGSYIMSVKGMPSNWGVLEYPVHIGQGGTMMPVVVGSHTHQDLNLSPRFLYHRAWVPAEYKPMTVTVPQRTFPAFTGVAGRHELAFTAIAPLRLADVYRTNVLPSGRRTTCNRENYYYSDLQQVMPPWLERDGPRGDGTIICPTSIADTLRPDWGVNGKCTGTTPWRVWSCDTFGNIRTIAGWRHDGDVPPYTNALRYTQHYPLPKPTLVGDWQTPVKGFHELWDNVYDPATLDLDPNATPVGGEQPHMVGPTSYVFDTQNNRICKLVSSKNDRTQPATVTDWKTGIGMPWNGAINGRVMYASLQKENRVVAYDLDTAAEIWSVTIATPTGLRYQDGFIYVGSLPSKAVLKVDIQTLALAKHCDVPTNNTSAFVNLAISDGTAWARGTIATVTWSNAQHGYPVLYTPTGAQFNFLALPSGKVPVGPPGPYGWTPGEPVLTYATAVDLKNGRMTWGCVTEGLCRVSRALPTDQPLPALFADGQKQWFTGGRVLTHGDGGWGMYGLPQPFGKTLGLDAYLTAHGHKP